MKYRILATPLHRALRTFPVIVVTGPRQSGKTTLLRTLLRGTHEYVNLEDPDTRMRAQEDPRGFLEQHAAPVVFDEIQYVPQLLPYIKTRVDERRKPGQWVLTGSQHFGLMQSVSESLAGRAAILSLLPFSVSERAGHGKDARDVHTLMKQLRARTHHAAITTPLAQMMLRGQYPEIASRPSVDRELWCGSYIATYLERDIRNLTQIGDLNQFGRFLRLCATRTGQILNCSDFARDLGVSVPTARRWLSLLETGYQVFFLYPLYRNIGKRLVKSPKLYFNDTALACHLLGLREPRTLLNSPHFPHLFETFVVVDFWKRFLHFGQLPSLYYLRTRDGLEVDLVLEVDGLLHLFEIRSSATITPKHASSVRRARNDLGDIVSSANLISRAPESYRLPDKVYSHTWQEILAR